MYVLGIWDGHDAGAALLGSGGEILFAVNEERLSRRKLEVGFPSRSIQACLDHAGLAPRDVNRAAASTSDPAKTLTRLVPGLKEAYYQLRRRKKGPGRFYTAKKSFKYRLTERAPNTFTRAASRLHLRRRLRAMGFPPDTPLEIVDHHTAHARAAAACSGFDSCAVLSLDGVGDGLAGSVWWFRQGELRLIRRFPARVSLGVFFEHVTNLLNMRELEDEGKVMALADFAHPVADEENPLLRLIRTRGLEIESDIPSGAMYRELKRILWRYPSEQFACMAQRTLEKCVTDLAMESLRAAGEQRIALAGGVFSNIKVNMKIAEQAPVEDLYVFPHMGDGGLALGAGLEAADRETGGRGRPLPDLYLGPEYTPEEILAALNRRGLPFRRPDDITEQAARRVLAGEIVLWFQGRMEYGPRSLGGRSILARPDDEGIRDRLNLVLKMRVWYQPFCPSLLAEDALALLDFDGRGDMESNRYMTTAFRVRPEHRPLMKGVTGRDGTCRPHLVREENPRLRALLQHVKKELGRGVVLNTSFNIHGEPVVCTPDDALDMFEKSDIRCLVLGDYLVEKELG